MDASRGKGSSADKWIGLRIGHDLFGAGATRRIRGVELDGAGPSDRWPIRGWREAERGRTTGGGPTPQHCVVVAKDGYFRKRMFSG